MSRPRRRRRRPLVALLALVLIVAAAGVGYAILKARTGNIFHSGVEFNAEHPGAKRLAPPDLFSWPVYGYTPDHLRYLDAHLAPPFARRWTFFAGGLLEFPPTIARGVLYQLNDNATVNAVDKETGRLRWTRRVGVLSASTPAVAGGVVFATVLKRSGGGGRIVALGASDGRVIWRRDLKSGSESSPMVSGSAVYFGSQDGTVYALRATDGSTLWTYKAAGSVKGSPTLKDGILYFGDYGGDVHAISAATGSRVWSASTSGALLGSGTFYATAAVAFGRVYIGNTDGRMYSFAARTGTLAWAHQTGNYVYASAAVLDDPRLGPTIYVGSYDGTMYAFDARTGSIRWQYKVGGKISGSATIVGRVIYFADLAYRTTTGLNVTTGRRVFDFHAGSFDPVISDGKRLYLSGYSSLVALDPVRAAAAAPSGAGTTNSPSGGGTTTAP